MARKTEDKREAQGGFYSNTQVLGQGDGETHWGKICVEGARLYTLPERSPLMLGAAITPQTAEWMDGWADGLLTVLGPKDDSGTIVDAFVKGGVEGKPAYVQVTVKLFTPKMRMMP
jgi:coenzyme F420-dependent glucose-6-phosphate dehydrogenase